MRNDVYAVLPDANILYSRTLRDWICITSSLSGETSHAVFTTEDTITEATYHYRRRHPAAHDEELSSIRRNLGQVARMITGYPIESDLPIYRDFPDPHDVHLFKAARHLPVDAVVTDDGALLRWASRHTDELPADVMSADDFLVQLAHYRPDAVRCALQYQHDYWKSKILSGQIESINYVERLRSAGAPRFAEHVSSLISRI